MKKGGLNPGFKRHDTPKSIGKHLTSLFVPELADRDDGPEPTHSHEQAQRDQILTIINNMTNAVFSTDKNGIITMHNAAALNLLDTNQRFDGQSIDSVLRVVDQSDAPFHLGDALKVTKSSVTRDDLNYVFDDGEEIRLELTYSPIRSSDSSVEATEFHEGYIVIARDITKEKSLEEERDEFISVVSHELRTPITIVEGSLSNLQFMVERGIVDAKSLRAAIDTSHEQALYLAKMVNDLSTLSRAERGVADTPESIDVAELIHKIYDSYHTEASAKGLHLDLDSRSKLGTINVSRLYVEELLQNFVTNAIKYTKEGSVTIIARTKADIVTFSVKDTGIGISRTDQQKVFQKFYRSEDFRIRETNGTGLGLYVSTKLAHKLGTQIKLVSRLNHGSTFSFNLPIAGQ